MTVRLTSAGEAMRSMSVKRSHSERALKLLTRTRGRAAAAAALCGVSPCLCRQDPPGPASGRGPMP